MKESPITLPGLQVPNPGERTQGMVVVPGVSPTWEMPAVFVRGVTSGPTLAVTAGIHAGEYVPIEAVTRLCRSLDPMRMHGNLVAILIVNTPGFFEHALYTNPRDGKNLGHGYPGNAHGTASERVADFIFQELVLKSDAYIDAHCGDLVEDLVPFTLWARVPDGDVTAKCAAMARVYGLGRTLVMAEGTVPTLTYAEAAAHGVPAIVGEVGEQGRCDEDAVVAHLQGMENVLGHLGIIAPPRELAPEPRQMVGFATTRTPVDATHHPDVVVGQHVVKGQRTGELHDLFGNKIQDVEALATGEVVFLVRALAVRAGDPLVGVGVLPS